MSVDPSHPSPASLEASASPDASARERSSHGAGERSRRGFLGLVGGTAAAGALSSLGSGCAAVGQGGGERLGTESEREQAEGDAGAMSYLLTLELLEADFYERVVKTGLVRTVRAAELMKEIREDELEHVEVVRTITASLGTTVPRPKTTFPLESEGQILRLAASLENLSAAAYVGQVDKLRDPDLLELTARIHSVEARHAAALNMLTGRPIVPDGAFARPATMKQVLREVAPFIAG